MLKQHEQSIVDRLNEEKIELKGYGHINSELTARIAEIDRQIAEIESGDTFRSYELSDVGGEIDDIVVGSDDLDFSMDGNEHGFVSENFHDPNLDY